MVAGAPQRTWRCGRYELSLAAPLVMGIVNATPDSFSDGGLLRRSGQRGRARRASRRRRRSRRRRGRRVDQAGRRPSLLGAEELARVRPVVKRLSAEDDRRSRSTPGMRAVAKACVEAGASIINDVSGFRDPEMVEVAASV